MDLRYLRENWDTVLDRTVEHLQLSLTALAFALPIAILLGVIAVRFRKLQFPIIATLGVAYTIPSLVILVFLIPSQGIGEPAGDHHARLYAQVFLVRNIVTGLRGVPTTTLEAARGVGMSSGSGIPARLVSAGVARHHRRDPGGAGHDRWPRLAWEG